MLDEVINVLCQRVVALQQQQEELVRREIALIATLTKVFPDFGQEFARQRIAVERLASPRDADELATILEALKMSVKAERMRPPPTGSRRSA